jgi:two-component system sensor histidine kinase/response regulator
MSEKSKEGSSVDDRLANANARLQAVLDAATQVSIIGTDAFGLITIFNKGAEILLGYSAQEVVGKLSPDYFHIPEELDARSRERSAHSGVLARGIDVLIDAARSGIQEEKEWTYVRKDGSNVRVLVAFTAMRDNLGKVTGYLGIAKDVTLLNLARERLQNAKDLAESASEAKSRFLANMSHELRTPLNGVIGTTQLILRSRLTPEQREYVETIRLSGDMLLSLINDILDFSKTDSGMLELESYPFDPSQCVEEVVRIMAPDLAKKHVEFVVDLGKSVPSLVLGDKARLKQVLIHLLNNAVKFTEKGEVVLKAGATRIEIDFVEILFTIHDTGVGMEAGTLDRLFKPFSQLDSSSTRRHGGAGLGLVLSTRIINLMHGRISIDSKPGEGSTIAFTITVQPCESQEEEGNASVDRALAGKKLLVAVKSKSLSDALESICTSWGMVAQISSDPTQMEAALKVKGDWDAILFDERLTPELKASEVSGSRGVRPPVILVKEWSMAEPPVPSSVEFDAVLLKPVMRNKFYEVLIALLVGPVDAPSQSGTGAASAEMQGKKARVLIAEDNQINQKLLVRILQKLGYPSDVVSNGREALAALKKEAYAFVFMDIQMPEMDGYEATRAIRQHYHVRTQPRIVAMTANAMREDRQMCLDAGMDDYLSKPVLIEDIDRSLRKWGLRPERQEESMVQEVPNAGIFIDPYLLARLRQLERETDTEFLLDLIEMYLVDAPRQKTRMLEAWNQGDAHAFHVAAHTLKGSSLNLGARDLGNVCKSLEEVGRSGNLGDAHDLLGRYDEEFEKLTIMLAAFRKETLRK